MNKIFVFVLILVVLICGAVLFFNFKEEARAPEPSTNLPQDIPQSKQTDYEDLYKKYVPQDSPEQTYLLEWELLSKGMYCYDLPMFDPEWRKRGKEILYSSSYKNTAAKFSVPHKVYIEGDYAVIYFPDNQSEGPDFLYKDSAGWILDRTAVWDNIHYNYFNTAWFAYDGDYPYLKLLKKVYSLQRIKLDNGRWAYSITEN